MDRALRANVVAKSARAVEVCGDIDVLLLDKTGTITVGARQATRFAAVPGVGESQLRLVAALASIEDPTPEGRSIVELARRQGTEVPEPSRRVRAVLGHHPDVGRRSPGRDLAPEGRVEPDRGLGPPAGGPVPAALQSAVDDIAHTGGTPLAVAEDDRILGVVALTDVLKAGMHGAVRPPAGAMGLETLMITGDNPLTAAAIAAEAGVDGFLAEATPEDKLARSGPSRRPGSSSR